MTRSFVRLFTRTGLMLIVITSGAAIAHAQQDRVTLRNIDLQPRSEKTAYSTLRKIDEAALHVCGAPGDSLTEVKRATRAGSCWQAAAGNAVRQSGNIMLLQAFARFPHASR